VTHTAHHGVGIARRQWQWHTHTRSGVAITPRILQHIAMRMKAQSSWRLSRHNMHNR